VEEVSAEDYGVDGCVLYIQLVAIAKIGRIRTTACMYPAGIIIVSPASKVHFSTPPSHISPSHFVCCKLSSPDPTISSCQSLLLTLRIHLQIMFGRSDKVEDLGASMYRVIHRACRKVDVPILPVSSSIKGQLTVHDPLIPIKQYN
jgi:hypothetical protein